MILIARFVPWGNALLATTILFTLVDRSNSPCGSSFFAATVIGVEMAVGVIDVIAVIDAFGVFGVLAAAVAIAPLTIADVVAIAAAAADTGALDAATVCVVVIFGFFPIIVLPDYRLSNIDFRYQCRIVNADGVCVNGE